MQDPSLDLLLQAGARYQHCAEAESVMAAGAGASGGEFSFGLIERPIANESEKRKQRKMDRLSKVATREKAKRLSAEADLTSKGTPAEVVGSIGLERVLGSRDIVDISFIELAIAMSRGVGRIRLANGFGTGFLVGPGLVMTNHHVISKEADALSALLQMDYQENSRGELLPVQAFKMNPGSFYYSRQDLDFTIVAVEPLSSLKCPLSSYPWIKLIQDIGKADVGDPVNIVQHPRGELKQIAFRSNTVLDIPTAIKGFLYYSTDTEPGSSGSPCFNDMWELVALHHSGVPRMDGQKRLLKKDGSLWLKGVDSPESIEWIANEGVRVSSIVEALKAADLRAEFRKQIDRMLELEPPNPIELARGGAAENAPAAPPAAQPAVAAAATTDRKVISMASNSQTWTIPIQVTVSIGVPEAAGAAANIVIQPPAPPAQEPAQEVVVIDPDFKARAGYDPLFLEPFTIPLPTLSKEMERDTVEVPEEFRRNGQKFILPYHNYAVVMNSKRRMAWFSACLIDGDNRPKITRDEKDKWFFDPRIDRKLQLGEETYADAHVDRGHVTRREDAAWGLSEEFARKANNDTFHFTNCTPQLSAFNQGKDRWQGLENFLLGKAKEGKRRMIVISGPVLAKNDPLYRNDKMTSSIRVPLKFWKVCAIVRPDNSLSATGFLLGQEDITDLDGFEKFDIPAAQVTLQTLEKKTGLKFGILTEHDHFAQGGAPGTLEVFEDGDPIAIQPIRTFDDIVL